MKICFFGDGDSVHIIRWCRHFASLGHEVSLISFKKVEIEQVACYFIDSGNISVKGGNWKVLLKFRRVKKILKEIKPDIFHAMYATSYGITGALCGYRPYVITAMGSDILISPNQSKIYRILLKFALSRANWITSFSAHMRDGITVLGISPEKVGIVPFGIDPAIFNDRQRTGSGTEFIITSTRNFEPVYNIPHLIHALALIKDQLPGLHLNLVGTGSLQHDYEKLIEKSGLEHQVSFTGRLSQQEVADTLRKSHVFVSVSLSDGGNNSLYEAMACGTFCIATDIPVNKEKIDQGENGFLVQINDVQDLADKILYVYHNYDELSQKALPLNRTLIEKDATWSTNMKKVESKYRELLTDGK